MPQPFDPLRDRSAAVLALFGARRQGKTLRQAAAIAGVHVATVCRWAGRSPQLAEALTAAARHARKVRRTSRTRRPGVQWHPDCPRCGRAVCVRTAGHGVGPRFWGCSAWPVCTWASWRPRYPEDCPRCGGPRFWAHSRKTFSCPACLGEPIPGGPCERAVH